MRILISKYTDSSIGLEIDNKKIGIGSRKATKGQARKLSKYFNKEVISFCGVSWSLKNNTMPKEAKYISKENPLNNEHLSFEVYSITI